MPSHNGDIGDSPVESIGDVACSQGASGLRHTLTEHERWEHLAAASPGVIISVEYDAAGEPHCLLIDDSCTTLLGFPPRTVMADITVLTSRVRPEDMVRIRRDLTLAASAARVAAFEVIYQHPILGQRWLEVRARPMRTAGGALLAHAFILDVSERKQLEIALSHDKERAEVTLASIGDAVITTDREGIVQYLNPVAEQLTGWLVAEATGRHISDVFMIRNELTGQPQPDPVLCSLGGGRGAELANHNALLTREGQLIAIKDCAAPIRAADGSILGAVVVFHDVTEQRQLAGELHHQATHDMLTGLPNRREFDRQLNQLIDVLNSTRGSNSRRGDPPAEHSTPRHALCYIDLDQFKVVNDTSGHVAGDELLRHIAEVLRTQIRQMDTLARLGGDEFGLLLRDCPLEQAITVADNLRHAVEQFRFTWAERSFRLGASVGLVPLHPGVGNATEVLEAADTACYIAKESGRNRTHVFEPSEPDASNRRRELQCVLRIQQALTEGEFVLHAQAIHAADPRSTERHYELLIRMLASDGTLLPPGSFLPSAERHQLATQVDRWVISTALSWIATNPQALFPGSRCWINLSGDSVNDATLAAEIAAMLSMWAIPGDRLCFEINETAAMANLPRTRSMINTLAEFGCQFALDDVGSGLSSFGYLKNLPVDYIKIDGLYVCGMIQDPVDTGIVRSINDIGHLLGKRTVAECVETEELQNMVTAMGVDLVQGYALGRSVPLESLSNPS